MLCCILILLMIRLLAHKKMKKKVFQFLTIILQFYLGVYIILIRYSIKKTAPYFYFNTLVCFFHNRKNTHLLFFSLCDYLIRQTKTGKEKL